MKKYLIGFIIGLVVSICSASLAQDNTIYKYLDQGEAVIALFEHLLSIESKLDNLAIKLKIIEKRVNK